jgi:hypothetical protein
MRPRLILNLYVILFIHYISIEVNCLSQSLSTNRPRSNAIEKPFDADSTSSYATKPIAKSHLDWTHAPIAVGLINRSGVVKQSVLSMLMLASMASRVLADEDKYIVKNARGAFEMDLDYYLKNIIGKPEPSLRRAVYKSPRTLSRPTAEAVFNIAADEISSQCNTPKVQILSSSFDILARNIKRFKEFLPIKNEILDDQYYFDVNMYSLYTAATMLLKESQDRVTLRSSVGSRIYRDVVEKEIVSSLQPVMKADHTSIRNLMKNIGFILKVFQSKGFISGYILDEEDASDEIYAKESFAQVRLFVFFTIYNFSFI